MVDSNQTVVVANGWRLYRGVVMRKYILASFLISCAAFSGGAAAGKTSYSSSSTITYNGTSYTYSSSSTCTDGTAALRYQRKWWCPSIAPTAAASTSTTTTTSTTSTSTPTTTAPVAYNAQLTWTIPTTRADGTPLNVSELSGYELYYTNDSGSVAVAVPVAGGTTSTATVSSLTSGNYSFSISAIDSAGLKSALSTLVMVSVP